MVDWTANVYSIVAKTRKGRHFVELVVNVMPQGKSPSLNLFDVLIFCVPTPDSAVRGALAFLSSLSVMPSKRWQPQSSSWSAWKLHISYHRCCFYGRFRKIAKSNCSFVSPCSACVSVLLHGTARLPLDGFSWNLMLEYISKICQENSSCIKIWQQ